jgi:hypothetical protein
MKLSVAICIGVLAIAGVMGLAVHQQHAVNERLDTPPTETRLEEHIRWMSEARGAVLTAVSNDAIGLSRVIDCNISDYDDDVRKWKAVVTFEFVNRVGGIERTNYPYKFFSGSHDNQNKRSLLVMQDVTEMNARWHEQVFGQRPDQTATTQTDEATMNELRKKYGLPAK